MNWNDYGETLVKIKFQCNVSARGIINLAHSDAQMNAYARRGNSMRLNGIVGFNGREEVKNIFQWQIFLMTCVFQFLVD